MPVFASIASIKVCLRRRKGGGRILEFFLFPSITASLETNPTKPPSDGHPSSVRFLKIYSQLVLERKEEKRNKRTKSEHTRKGTLRGRTYFQPFHAAVCCFIFKFVVTQSIFFFFCISYRSIYLNMLYHKHISIHI